MKVFLLTKKEIRIQIREKKAGIILMGILVFALVSIAFPAWSADYYLAQSAAGSGNASSCANAKAISWNWTSPNVIGGDTVHLCGTITSQFAISRSGTSGHPITVKFESGAKFSAPVWGAAYGALSCSGQQYIIIDGNNVGIIENTGNGDSLATKNNSTGIYSNCDNTEIKNLTIRNLYVKVYNSEAAGRAVDTSGLTLYGSNVSAHHNTISMTAGAITHINTGGTIESNISLHHNTTKDTNWGIQAVVGVTGSVTDSVSIFDNDIALTDAWTIDTQPNWYHHNGSYCFSGDSLGVLTNLSYYNNYIHSSTSHSWAATGFIHADYRIKSIKIYNNLLVGDANGYPSPSYIFVNNGGTTNAAIEIYNNTIIGVNSARGIMLDTPGAGTLLTMKNNIVSGNAIGLQVVSPNNVTIVSDNNNFYNNTYVAYIGGYLTTLANLKTYLGGGCPSAAGNDCSSITDNPDLNANYTPKAAISPVISKGANLSSTFTTDKAGASRPQGSTWTIGAYENSSLLKAPNLSIIQR